MSFIGIFTPEKDIVFLFFLFSPYMWYIEQFYRIFNLLICLAKTYDIFVDLFRLKCDQIVISKV